MLFVCVSEQVLSPLHFVDKLCEVDFEATVDVGGPAGQAGALRLALSRALLAFVDKDTAEKMRLGTCAENSCFRKYGHSIIIFYAHQHKACRRKYYYHFLFTPGGIDSSV